jgi:hypothetical protein
VIRIPGVIGIQTRNPRRGALGSASIPRDAGTGVFLANKPEAADSASHFLSACGAIISRPIVDDNHFFGRNYLAADALERSLNCTRLVVEWNCDGDV